MTDQEFHISGDIAIKLDTITDQRGAERVIRLVEQLGSLTSGGITVQALNPGVEDSDSEPEIVDPTDFRDYLVNSERYKTPAAATSQATRLLHSFSGMCESIIRRHEGKAFDFPMQMLVTSTGSFPTFATMAYFVDYIDGLNTMQRQRFFSRAPKMGERSYEILKGYVESKRTTPVQE